MNEASECIAISYYWMKGQYLSCDRIANSLVYDKY